MIKAGSTAVIRTVDAIYQPCQVTAISKENVTVAYFAGMRKDRATGRYKEDHRTETIPCKKILSMQERV